ncbi:polysaccharide deacetylase family protein [Streptomyces sp. MBT65]|nr:polysaccharide deacetylase family protein [Streptomyces sp. MBT65]
MPMLPRQGRLPVRRKATWSQLFQTGHGWAPGGSGVSSSNANDTSDFAKGTQAVRVTTNGTGLQSNIRKTGMTAMDLTGKMMRLTFKVDDVTNLDRIVFYVGTSNLVNYFQFNFHTHSTTASSNYVQSGEWVTVHVSWADLGGASGSYSVNANGTPSTTTGFTDMSFALYDKAPTAGLTFHLQSIELVPDTATTFPNGVVSITFDDSWQSVYDLARPKMDALGFAGTIYNIVEYIDSGSTRLSLSEMRSLQNVSGWEMGGHSFSAANHGVGFQALTADVVAKDFQLMRAWLVDKGFTSEHFAYPHGAFGLTSDGVPVDQLAAQYFTSARSIISETIETFAPAIPHRLKSPTGINDGTGLGGIPLTSMTSTGGKLDRCANSGDWLILAMHEIKSSVGAVTDATHISQAGFNTLMDGIAARGIPVLPVGDVLRYYS